MQLSKAEMAFRFEKIVPWGRSLDEYVAMFSLSEEDLNKRILGCGDGPAGFNSVLTRRGGSIVSVDPLYKHSASEIEKRIDETYEQVLSQTRKNRDEFLWERIASVEELGRIRMAAMELFLNDFSAGLLQGRYVPGSLPNLPFRGGAFDIALSSHFLFLYCDHLNVDFHLSSIEEMCRVAGEARVFPLLDLAAKPSPYVAPVKAILEDRGYKVKIKTVEYEFQKGGNEMMTITHP